MLALEHISVSYGGVAAVTDVSVHIPKGAIVALIGPNAAGKTTTLRAASGLVRPEGGRILHDGVDLTGRPAHAYTRRGICHIPEGRGVFGSLTVRENLLLQSRSATGTEAVEIGIAAFPELEKRLDQPARLLSGGEQQMLALARATLQEPEVVLLDEVSMGLAPVIVDRIFEYFEALASRGTSLLLVEQYVNRVLPIADLVYLLNGGRLAFAGEPIELDQAALLSEYMGVSS